MNIFCTILLVGFAAYVGASKHDCDPFAANTKKKDGTEKDDQVIPLESFSAVKEVRIFYFTFSFSTSLAHDSIVNI